MTQETLLWLGGIGATLVGSLSLILLTRVLKQGDDTNKKVTDQGLAIARLEGLPARVDSLDEWRNRMQQRALELAEERAIEAERRLGPPDRRGAV